ncbi:MAG: hypothetical protein AB4050_18110 [Synechococcus sp.]
MANSSMGRSERSQLLTPIPTSCLWTEVAPNVNAGIPNINGSSAMFKRRRFLQWSGLATGAVVFGDYLGKSNSTQAQQVSTEEITMP